MDLPAACTVIVPGALLLLPEPVSGWLKARSGCAPASVFGIRFGEAFPAIVCGAVTAALITTLPLLDLLHAFGGA